MTMDEARESMRANGRAAAQAEAAARRAQLRLKEAEEKVSDLDARAGLAARSAPAHRYLRLDALSAACL